MTTKSFEGPSVLCPACGGAVVATRCTECGFAGIVCGQEDYDPRIGEVIDGKYRIERLVGRGGMGRIYAAIHEKLGEPCAVKFLMARWAYNARVRARFHREAVALAKLRHPGVVSVFDVGEAGEEPYIVMELVFGKTFADRLDGDPIPLEETVEILTQVLEVLVAAHAVGILHRDVKPANIMLAKGSGRVKLLDFGIAHVPSEGAEPKLTETGSVHGTPHYMSPEQCRGLEVGPATDVYAVGIMLFEALAGGTPFDAGDIAAVMTQHMFVDPPRIAEVGRRAAVPAGFERIVRLALAKKPEERPTAVELRDLLHQVAGGADPLALMGRSTAERQRIAGLPREDRAPLAPASNPPPADAVASGVAVLWMPAGARATSLRDAFSVNEIRVASWAANEAPPASIDGVPVRVVVVVAEAGMARVQAVREGKSKAAVVVVDVSGVEQTTEAIRGGAADVALKSVGDADVAKKVRRLLRRSR